MQMFVVCKINSIEELCFKLGFVEQSTCRLAAFPFTHTTVYTATNGDKPTMTLKNKKNGHCPQFFHCEINRLPATETSYSYSVNS